MKLKLISGILLSIFLVSCKTDTLVTYEVIPAPQSVEYKSGVLKLDKVVKVAYSADLSKEASFIKEALKSDFGVEAELVKEAKNADISLVMGKQGTSEKEDGYSVNVSSKGIKVSSSSATGIFYGIQTLRQIIQKKEEMLIVQKGTVSDSPRFSWRSFMLDEGRHFKGKEVVKQLLDEMALLKMNVFHWHLTEDQGWRIEIKKYPKLTEIGSFRDSTEINHFGSNVYDGKPHSGFYTQEDIKEIVAYAADRHILVVPEIEMPGHASAAIAAYPWLGTTGKQINVPCKFGVQYDIFNVTDPKVIEFFTDVIDEVIALFPSPVFHIGGDEVRYNQWNESPEVKSYMEKNNIKTPAELQVFFTNKISNILAAKNKRMMGWNEITGAKLHEYQSEKDTKEGNEKLADGTIVHFWKGDSSLILNTIHKGYDIVNSDNVYTYLDYDYKAISLQNAYDFNPIPAGLPKELETKVLGTGCQMWGEFIPTVESMNYKVYPRLAAYAEGGWTAAENKNYSRFKKALPHFLNRWSAMGIKYGPVE